MKKSILPICLLYSVFSILYSLFSTQSSIMAQDMSSKNFKLQSGNLNMTSGNKSSTNFKLSDVVGQNAAAFFSSKGYFVQSGFLNSAASTTFSLSLNPTLVDFGSLIPKTPVERTLQISISNGDTPGYSISVSEDKLLSTSALAQIPNTLCDDEKNPCTSLVAQTWSQDTVYGLGYALIGRSVLKDFTAGKYRSFPITSHNEQPAQIMLSQQKKAVDQANMTIKLNIDANQPVGQYRNTLNFTAIAGI